MKRSVVVGVAFLVAIAFATGAFAEMKEGLWEITTKAEMKGMGGGQMPATTMKSCISKKDMVPKPVTQEKGQECKMKDQKISGDTVTYAMECNGKDGSTVEMNGKMTYKGDIFEGTSNMTMKSKNEGAMQMSSKMTGKYLGPCPK